MLSFGKDKLGNCMDNLQAHIQVVNLVMDTCS